MGVARVQNPDLGENKNNLLGEEIVSDAPETVLEIIGPDSEQVSVVPEEVDDEIEEFQPDDERFTSEAYQHFLAKHTPEYITEQDGEFRVVTSGALLNIDIKGSTDYSDALQQHFAEQFRATQHRQFGSAIGDFRNAIAEVSIKVENIVHAFGGRLIDQIGDGTVAIFEGENGVERASLAAGFINTQINQSARDLMVGGERWGKLTVKMSADTIENNDPTNPDLIIFNLGDQNRRITGIVGQSVNNSEALQKQASVGSGNYLNMSEEFSSALIDTVPDIANLAQKTPSSGASIGFRESLIPISLRNELRDQFIHRPDTPMASSEVNGIYFAELNGFNDLVIRATNGDEEARIALRNLCQILTTGEEDFGGRVNSIFGERMLVNFSGDPDGLQSGIRFGQSLQNFASTQIDHPIRLQSALHVGTVIEAEVGRSRTIFSQSVNATARLATHQDCPPLAVTDDVRNQLGGRLCLQTESLAPAIVKGIERPIAWSRLESVHNLDAMRRVDVVGRNEVMTQIDDIYKRAQKTGQPQRLWLSGEAGIGKSAVMSAVSESPEGNRRIRLVARADSFQRRDSFGPFRGLAEQLFELSSSANQEDINQRVGEIFTQLDIDEQNQDIIALLNPIAGSNFEVSEHISTLSESEREELTAGLLAKLIELDGEPKFVQAEDLHFYSPSALRLLRHLNNKLVGPTILTFTARPEELHDMPEADRLLEDINQQPGTEVIELPHFAHYLFSSRERVGDNEDEEAQIQWWNTNQQVWYPFINRVLNMAETVTYFDRVRQENVTVPTTNFPGMRRLACYVSEKAKGNPFYAQEILRYLAIYQSDQELLVPNANGQTTFGSQRIRKEIYKTIPEVEQIELKKFETLDSEAREILIAGATIGMRFNIEELQVLLPSNFTARRITTYLRSAIDRGFVRHIRRDDGEDFYVFTHEIAQGSIYNRTADEGLRRQRHDRFLDYLENKFSDADQQRQVMILLERHARSGSRLSRAMRYSNILARDLHEQGFYMAASEKAEPTLLNFLKLSSENGFANTEVDLHTALELMETYRLIRRDDATATVAGVEIVNVMRAMERWIGENVEQQNGEPVRDLQLAYFKLNLAIESLYARAEGAIGQSTALLETIDNLIPEGVEGMDMAYLLQKQATVLTYLKRYEEALQVWNREKEIYDSAITSGDSEPEWIQPFYMLGLVVRKRLHGASDPETLKFALQAYDVASMSSMKFKSVMAQEVGNLFAFMVPDYTEQARTFLEIADETAMQLYRKPNSTSAKVRGNLGVLEMSEGHFMEAARLFDQSAHLHYEVNPSSIGVFAELYSSTRASMFARNMNGVRNDLNRLHELGISNDDALSLIIHTIEIVSNGQFSLDAVNTAIERIQNSNKLADSEKADALANLAVGLARNGQPERGAQVAEMSFEFYRSHNDQCGIRELQFALAS